MAAQVNEQFRAPWWLWPNLLSLDAALVAVVWQRFLAETITAVQPVATAILGLSVWLVYTADRLLDTSSACAGAESPRHQFARAYRRPLGLVAVPVFLLDVGLAFAYLPAAQILAGFVLVAAVVARFYAVVRPPNGVWRKELWTAVIFAAGVWGPVLLSNPFRPGVLEFVLLCWWNCLAIETWERPILPRPLVAAAGGLAVGAVVFFAWTHRPVALAEAISALGFCFLAAWAHKFSTNARRVAVDFCLLSPLLVYVR